MKDCDRKVAADAGKMTVCDRKVGADAGQMNVCNCKVGEDASKMMVCDRNAAAKGPDRVKRDVFYAVSPKPY